MQRKLSMCRMHNYGRVTDRSLSMNVCGESQKKRKQHFSVLLPLLFSAYTRRIQYNDTIFQRR